MISFAANIEKWAEEKKVDMDKALLAVAEEALARVKELTPVRTGNLRAGWTIVPLGEEAPVEPSLATMGAGAVAGYGAQKAAEKVATRMGTSASRIAMSGNVASSVAYAGVSVAAGEMTPIEGVGSVGGQVAGTAAGAALGAFGGPIGIAVGGFIGGMVGSSIGQFAAGAAEDFMSKPKGYSIVNPVSYAPYIEYGWQRTLPSGKQVHVEGRFMMRQTVAELPTLAAKALNRVTNQDAR